MRATVRAVSRILSEAVRMSSIVSLGTGELFLGRDRRRQNRRKLAGLPAKNGLRLDDDRLTPRTEQARAQKELRPVDEAQRWALGRRRRTFMVAQHGVLDEEFAPRSARVSHDSGDLTGGIARGQA